VPLDLGQVINRHLSTAIVFSTTLGHVEFVLDKMSLGQIFSEYFGFPCQFRSTDSSELIFHLSTGAGIIEPLEDSVSAHPTNEQIAGYFICTRPFRMSHDPGANRWRSNVLGDDESKDHKRNNGVTGGIL
jgi:hypothetical protein